MIAIRVENPKGGYSIVDSYDPDVGEIISRKQTQLADIKLESAIRYLTDFARLYSPGKRILPTPNAGNIGGQVLKGKMILEVPIQMRPIPKAVLERAAQLEIRIRDVHGNFYN